MWDATVCSEAGLLHQLKLPSLLLGPLVCGSGMNGVQVFVKAGILIEAVRAPALCCLDGIAQDHISSTEILHKPAQHCFKVSRSKARPRGLMPGRAVGNENLRQGEQENLVGNFMHVDIGMRVLLQSGLIEV